MLCREEIIDKRQRLCGYRFTFRAGGKRVAPAEYAFFDALEAIDLKEFAARRLAVAPVTMEGIDMRQHGAVVSPNTMFLVERRHATLNPQDIAARLAALKKEGCRTALNGASLAPEEAPLLEQADAVFLSLSDCSLPQFQSLMKQLRAAYPALQIVVENVTQAQRDELFLVGLLSLFDILLGMPMTAILDKMHLSDAVREVLLRSAGPYCPYLMLALQVEKGQVGRAAEIAATQGIDPDTLGETSAAAFQWAQEALHHSMD